MPVTVAAAVAALAACKRRRRLNRGGMGFSSKRVGVLHFGVLHCRKALERLQMPGVQTHLSGLNGTSILLRDSP